MPPEIELSCLGFAAVIDSVLLLVVLERVNRPLTALWLKWAVAGVTLWHVGSFLHATLRRTDGEIAGYVDGFCMVAMAFGLLLLTSAMLHGAIRINHVGAIAHPVRDHRYLIVYFPVLFVLPVTAAIFRSGSRDFIVATRDYQIPYVAWLTLSNFATAFLLVRNRDQYDPRSVLSGRFMIRFSIGLCTVTLMTLWYLFFSWNSKFEEPVRLVTTLSPLLPTLIFCYYVFRRRLLPLVFERTLAYGAILLAFFYVHNLTIGPLVERYSDTLEFDLVLVEGLLLVALTLAYSPLRDRIREALRYLVGGNVTRIRDATRKLSVELCRRSANDVNDMSVWFVQGLMESLGLRFAIVYWSGGEYEPAASFHEDEPDQEVNHLVPADTVSKLERLLHDGERDLIDRTRCRSVEELTIMREIDLAAAFRIQYQDVRGMLLLGATLGGDRLSDEQLNTISVLVDQFAASVENRRLQDARQRAERRAAQQEKLSTLGLLSGSLAHELKNPLSSIKTIATLLREDLGHGENADDVGMIIGEIDRLSQTTQSLLDFSRPAAADQKSIAPDVVVERLLQILKHLARQHNVRLETDLNLRERRVTSSDAAVSEILFNLIKNAIEAAREKDSAAVHVFTSVDEGFAVLEVVDNGSGISDSQQQTIFEPFVTGKTDGTGLGLYVVSERVRECHGTIDCHSEPGKTVFKVRLPLITDDDVECLGE